MSTRFRLVDLIFAVVVVLLLGGILLVTLIGPSHDTPRRAQCQNNLRQIALGHLGYQAATGRFPASVISAEGHGVGQTCFTAILPYIDNQDLFNAYNFNLENWHPANAPFVDARIGVFRCPGSFDQGPTPASQVVRLDGTKLPGDSTFAPCHYAVNWGGGRAGWGRDFEKTCGQNRGVMRENWGARPADLVDGAATTVMAGEKRKGQGWAVGGWAASEFDVGVSPFYKGDDPTARMVYTGSEHLSGTNFAFSDGSVRALTAAIDRKLWYALITRDGREAVNKEGLK